MNVLFVNYQDFTSNSAVHIFNLANELVGLGAGCAVGVPGDPATIELLGTPQFQALGFNDARKGALRFPDGGPPRSSAPATAAPTSSISRTTRTYSRRTVSA